MIQDPGHGNLLSGVFLCKSTCRAAVLRRRPLLPCTYPAYLSAAGHSFPGSYPAYLSAAGGGPVLACAAKFEKTG